MRCAIPLSLAGILVLCMLVPLRAQEDDVPELATDAGPVRKTPSLFRRPSRETAADQLAYADALRDAGQTEEAVPAYAALVHTWHDAPEAPGAQLAYARLLYKAGAYRKAFDEFQYLVDFFPGRFPFDDVLDHQFRIANQVRTETHGDVLFFKGFQSPERALPLLEKILRNAPAWKKAPEVQFHIGLIHEDRKEYEDAILAFENLRYRFPESDFATDATFRRARCLYRIALRSPRDERACRAAMAALSAFLRDHGTTPSAEAARGYLDERKEALADMYFERALFYDRKPDKPKSALIAYTDFLKNFPASPRTAKARERIAALERELGEQE